MMQMVSSKGVFAALLTACALTNASADSYSTGSGCFISSNEVLTACHVVADGSEIIVALEDGDWMKATIMRSDKGLDWALLKVQGSSLSTVAVSDRPLELGDKVYTLGYPSASILGLGLKYADGVVSSLTGLAGDVNRFQITIPIQPGNSGGPIFDEKGCLVGIVSSTVDPDKFYALTGGALPQNLNFALPIGKISLTIKTGNGSELKNNKKATCFVRCKPTSTHLDKSDLHHAKTNIPPRDRKRVNLDRLNETDGTEIRFDAFAAEEAALIAQLDPSSPEVIEYMEEQRIIKEENAIKLKSRGYVGIVDIGKLFSFELGKPCPKLFSHKYIERENTFGCKYEYNRPFLNFKHGYAEISKKSGTLISLHAFTDTYEITDKEDEKAIIAAADHARLLIEEKFGIRLTLEYDRNICRGGEYNRAPNCLGKESVYLGKQWAYTSWTNYYSAKSDYDSDPHHIISVSIYEDWRKSIHGKVVWISLTGSAEDHFAAEEIGAKERDAKRHQEELDAL